MTELKNETRVELIVSALVPVDRLLNAKKKMEIDVVEVVDPLVT